MKIVLLGKLHFLAFRTFSVRHCRTYSVNRILDTLPSAHSVICDTSSQQTLCLCYNNHSLVENQTRDQSRHLVQSKHLKGHQPVLCPMIRQPQNYFQALLTDLVRDSSQTPRACHVYLGWPLLKELRYTIRSNYLILEVLDSHHCLINWNQ